MEKREKKRIPSPEASEAQDGKTVASVPARIRPAAELIAQSIGQIFGSKRPIISVPPG
jgi:hypothetical protein